MLVLITSTLLITPKKAECQLRNIIDRTYTIVGIGANGYVNDKSSPGDYIGYNGQVGLGMNLFDGVGGRANLTYLNNTNVESIKSNYLSFNLELTFDMLNTLFKTNHQRNDQLLFSAGLGYVVRQKNYLEPSDNEASVTLGLTYTHPLGNKIYLFGELKSFLFVPCFDYNLKASAFVLGTMGIQYRFCDNPYRNGLMDGGTKMHENWFVSITGGVNSLTYNGIRLKDRLRLMRPAAELMIGKYFTPVMGMRIGVNGLKAATDANPGFKITNVHLDLLLNLSNMQQPKPGRAVSYYLYAGAGMLNRLDSHTMTMGGNVGFLTRFWISRWSDIIAEARYFITTPGFAHDQPGQHGLSVGMATISLGYVLNLTSGSMR